MEALRKARADLEHERVNNDAGAAAWERKCVQAVSAQCAAMEARLRQVSGPVGQGKVDGARITRRGTTSFKDALGQFYSKYNPEKLGELDKVVAHFAGRVEALNEALMLQYGNDLSEFMQQTANATATESTSDQQQEKENDNENEGKRELTPEEKLKKQVEKVKDIFTEAIQELHLPRREYQFRSCSSNSMFGFKDLWLELVHGSLRLDLCLRERRPKVFVPELCLRTEKALKLKCKALGLKIVDNVAPSEIPSKSLGKSFDMESVSIDAELDLNLSFWFSKTKGWYASPSYSFDMKKLKTQRPLVDQLLRTVINATVPSAIKKKCAELLPKELGLIMIDPSVIEYNRTKAMGFAFLFEINVEGWPTTNDFSIDLYDAVRSNSKQSQAALAIMKKLKITMAQLETLHLLNVEFGGTKSKGGGIMSFVSSSKDKGREPWERGVFPLQAITLEELVNLQQGLYVGELVSIDKLKRGEEDNSDDEASVCTEDLEEGVWSGSEGTKEDDESEEEDSGYESDTNNNDADQDPSSSSSPSAAWTNTTTAGLSEFKNFQANTTFADEYARVISCAAKAQAVAQEKLDKICDAKNVPRWSLGKLIQHVESAVCRKHVSMEIHLQAIDFRINVDVLLEVLEAFFWRILKQMKSKMTEVEHNKALRNVHKAFTTAKVTMFALKGLAGSMKFTTTGAVTGGNFPAFEFSIKDISAEGVLDLQLSNLRVGGNFKEFAQWFLLFIHRLKSNSVMSKVKRKQSTKAIGEVKEHLMRHLELVQFFLECSLSKIHFASLKHLIFAVTAQQGDPRPPLSLHIAGDLWKLFPKDDFYVDNDLMHGFTFPKDHLEESIPGGAFLDQLENPSKPVADLLKTIISSQFVETVTRQEAFWIYGFTKYILSLTGANTTPNFDDVDTDIDE